jgi:hypothetical protein
VTLPLPHTVPNVAAAMVTQRGAAKFHGIPEHQGYMAFEGGSFTALNVGTDRDLSKNWELVKPECKQQPGMHCGGGFACPTARYNPMDQYYYVFGGGNDISIMRSKDLGAWERRNMSMATHCIAQEVCLKYRRACTAEDTSYESCCGVPPDCSPASGEGKVASGYFEEYWAAANATSDRSGRRMAFFGNISRWDWSVNDADFCDEGGKGPTRFIYGMCQQTKPANATAWDKAHGLLGSGGYHLGTFDGNESEWLSSFFP